MCARHKLCGGWDAGAVVVAGVVVRRSHRGASSPWSLVPTGPKNGSEIRSKMGVGRGARRAPKGPGEGSRGKRGSRRLLGALGRGSWTALGAPGDVRGGLPADFGSGMDLSKPENVSQMDIVSTKNRCSKRYLEQIGKKTKKRTIWTPKRLMFDAFGGAIEVTVHHLFASRR